MADVPEACEVLMCMLLLLPILSALDLELATQPHKRLARARSKNLSVLAREYSTNQLDSSQENSCDESHNYMNLTNTNGTMNNMPCGIYNVSYFCNFTRSYQFHLSKGYGFVLNFHEIPLHTGISLTVYGIYEENENQSLRRISDEKLDLSPLLAKTNVLKVVINIEKDKSVSSIDLNISCMAHSLEDIPNELELDDQTNVAKYSKHIYSCSTIKNIPHGIKCDMVPQCLNGEDEINCSYKNPYCNDSIPYKETCLEIRFINRSNYKKNEDVSTAPLIANDYCESNFTGSLASVPDEAGLNLVTNIIKNAGFNSVAVGLFKYGTKIHIPHTQTHAYRFMWQWIDGLIAHNQIFLQYNGSNSECAMLVILPKRMLIPTPCRLYESFAFPEGFVCQTFYQVDSKQYENETAGYDSVQRKNISSLSSENANFVHTKTCPDGSYVQIFQPCVSLDRKSGNNLPERNFPLFICNDGVEISYTYICDGYVDCLDGSDELRSIYIFYRLFFFINKDPLFDSTFVCRTGQHFHKSKRCNGVLDCNDGSDEYDCLKCASGTVFCPKFGCVPHRHAVYIDGCQLNQSHPYNPPEIVNTALIELDGWGFSIMTDVTECPETHKKCTDWACIPKYLEHNGEKDCLQWEDEKPVVQMSRCAGLYYCHNSDVCVHLKYMCDGIYHCPNQDDEIYCNLTCPAQCVCEGYSFKCEKQFNSSEYLFARYLDLSGTSQQSLNNLQKMLHLHFLNLSNCSLQSADMELPRPLVVLDLSVNKLIAFEKEYNTALKFINVSHSAINNITLTEMLKLAVLDLSFNNITNLEMMNLKRLPALRHLNLSHNTIFKRLDSTFKKFLAEMLYLETLYLANTGINSIADRVFENLKSLTFLDISKNTIEEFKKDMFWGLTKLHYLMTEQNKMCCAYFHARIPVCISPDNADFSCEDLLISNLSRICLWSICILAISGNVGVLVYRLCFDKQGSYIGYRTLVINLCMSDLIMGVYLLIIGSADAHFHGEYVKHDLYWKRSPICQAAGFMAFLSHEASTFLICIITLDRIIRMRFSLNSSFRLFVRVHVIAVMCSIAWVMAVILAGIPFLPVNIHWEFYNQTNICLPLPISRRSFGGESYVFGVFVVLNFILFLFIGTGQALIYSSVRASAVASRLQCQMREVNTAKTLFLITFSYFCCWFPLGLIGLLASQGIPISEKIYILASVFILPFNSALDPFLYTVINISERWKLKREEQRFHRLLSNLKVTMTGWQTNEKYEFIDYCIKTNLISKDILVQCIGNEIGGERKICDEHEVVSQNVECETIKTEV